MASSRFSAKQDSSDSDSSHHKRHHNGPARITTDGRFSLNISDRQVKLVKRLLPHLRPGPKTVDPKEAVPAWQTGEPVEAPPALNIVIQITGSRGDVQPFLALGKELKEKYGHRVRLATHGTFKKFVEDTGLEFFNIGGDPAQLMDYMQKNPGLIPGKQSLKEGDVGKRKKELVTIMDGCWRSCIESGDGMGEDHEGADDQTRFVPFVADAIIANPVGFAHVHCAEKLGIPFHLMFTMPYSPTQAFPHPLANIQSSDTDPSIANLLSYPLVTMLTYQGLGGIINEFREHTLGLEPISIFWMPHFVYNAKVPFTYCWSPALIPKPADWGPHIAVAGFYNLPHDSDYTPPNDLKQFLDAGEPPVYIGFGSIVADDPDEMTQLIFEGVKKAGVRALVSKGWGGLGGDKLDVPDDVFLLDAVPHDWLFKQVSAVCHHGGAGTCAAGIAAGRPTIVVPFFGDQPFWGAMVARSGAGPDPIPHKKLTSDKLAEAIKYCLEPERKEAAQKMADQMKEENGPEVGAKHFHVMLPKDKMKCALVPKLPAAWRVKKSDVRLSTLAAAVLCERHMMSVDDLKLNRPSEYDLTSQPTDPVTGILASVFGSLANFFIGAVDMPAEFVDAIRTDDPHAQARHAATHGSIPPELTGALVNGSDKDITKEPTNLDDKRANNEHHATRAMHSIAHTSAHLSKLPRELILSMARGFHNAPKLYNDRTVREPDKVVNFKTGMKAAGKEATYGMYDAFSGVVTQPYKGAKESGTLGFVKGIGKGLAGLALKPEAAVLGAIGHSLDAIYRVSRTQYLHYTIYEHGNKPTAEETLAAIRLLEGYEAFHKVNDETKESIQHGFEELIRVGKAKPRKKAEPKLEARDQYLNDVLHQRGQSVDSNTDSAGELALKQVEGTQPPVGVEDVRPSI